MDTQEYYVVFTDAEVNQWFTRFLHPGYGHCYVVWWDGFNWIRMRPDLTHVAIEVLPLIDSGDVELVVLGNTAVHVEVPVNKQRVRTPLMLAPATCTEACKAVLGIRAPFVFTPRQLFNYLVTRKHERWWRKRGKPGTEEAPTASTG